MWSPNLKAIHLIAAEAFHSKPQMSPRGKISFYPKKTQVGNTYMFSIYSTVCSLHVGCPAFGKKKKNCIHTDTHTYTDGLYLARNNGTISVKQLTITEQHT